MGWGNCGEDSKGRPIGYYHDATCDHPGCKEQIHRGLAYACGGMHGEGNHYNDDFGCEGYFCGKHMKAAVVVDDTGTCVQLCEKCASEAEAAHPDWQEL